MKFNLYYNISIIIFLRFDVEKAFFPRYSHHITKFEHLVIPHGGAESAFGWLHLHHSNYQICKNVIWSFSLNDIMSKNRFIAFIAKVSSSILRHWEDSAPPCNTGLRLVRNHFSRKYFASFKLLYASIRNEIRWHIVVARDFWS